MQRNSRRLSVALWTIQGGLALLFLFAGSMKLIMPIEMLTAQTSLPGWFIQFIGVCEMLGALGLVLPGIVRIHTELTPLAAAGLVCIMVGATTMTYADGGIAAAWFPFVVGLLASFVAYGRVRLAPQRSAARRLVLQPAA